MSIINISKTVSVEDIVNKIKQGNTSIYRIVEAVIRNNFHFIWENRDFTPKQIIDAFGTDAKDLFILSGTLQALLKQVNPDYVEQVPTKEFTIEADGKITVAE